MVSVEGNSSGAPAPRGQRGRLPPLPLLYGGARGQRNALYYNTSHIIHQTRMWANAQRDGRPADYRWRPLFNAAKFG